MFLDLEGLLKQLYLLNPNKTDAELPLSDNVKDNMLSDDVSF